MTTSMTPMQAVLRRVRTCKRGRTRPQSSVYVVAQFAADHPIRESHYNEIVAAVGARWARVIKRHKRFVHVAFIFDMSMEDFERVLAEARALPTRRLSRTVLRVALQTARETRSRPTEERRPHRSRSKHTGARSHC